MNQNTIQGTGNIASINVLANARELANVIREINKPIYEFVSAIDSEGKFVSYTRLIRRDK